MAQEQVKHGPEIARLSMSVYLELMTILGGYRKALVLVGGRAEPPGRLQRPAVPATVSTITPTAVS